MADIMTVSMRFTHQAIPELFHSSPEMFLRLLEKDGNKFLRFYWNEAAKQSNQTSVPITGMNYELHKPNTITFIGLITLPPPTSPGESYYAACIYRPHRVLPFGFISDVSKVLLLNKSDYEGYADIVEITPKKEWIELRQIEVSKQNFFVEIFRELELKVDNKTPG